MSAISLPSGLQQLGLDLSADQQDKLLAFRDLLLKWNKTYNLTALRDPEQAKNSEIANSNFIRYIAKTELKHKKI